MKQGQMVKYAFLSALSIFGPAVAATDDNIQVIAAISRLEGLVAAQTAQVESLKTEMKNTADFARAAYGTAKELAQKMAANEKLQQDALKAMAGTSDPNVLIQKINEFKRLDSAPAAKLPENA